MSWKVGVRPLPLPLLHSSGLVEEITWLVRFDSAMPFGKMFMLPGLTHVPERWGEIQRCLEEILGIVRKEDDFHALTFFCLL